MFWAETTAHPKTFMDALLAEFSAALGADVVRDVFTACNGSVEQARRALGSLVGDARSEDVASTCRQSRGASRRSPSPSEAYESEILKSTSLPASSAWLAPSSGRLWSAALERTIGGEGIGRSASLPPPFHPDLRPPSAPKVKDASLFPSLGGLPAGMAVESKSSRAWSVLTCNSALERLQSTYFTIDATQIAELYLSHNCNESVCVSMLELLFPEDVATCRALLQESGVRLSPTTTATGAGAGMATSSGQSDAHSRPHSKSPSAPTRSAPSSPASSATARTMPSFRARSDISDVASTPSLPHAIVTSCTCGLWDSGFCGFLHTRKCSGALVKRCKAFLTELTSSRAHMKRQCAANPLLFEVHADHSAQAEQSAVSVNAAILALEFAQDLSHSSRSSSGAPIALDLHGLNVPTSLLLVRWALCDAIDAGMSGVRVITGKGSHSAAGGSRLKPAVWSSVCEGGDIHTHVLREKRVTLSSAKLEGAIDVMW